LGKAPGGGRQSGGAPYGRPNQETPWTPPSAARRWPTCCVRSAKRFPLKTAIECGATRWSFAEFDGVTERLRPACRAWAWPRARGCRAGAQLARLSALRFALARLGAVLVPINFMLKAEEVAYILRHAGAG
jgi:acyl-CoA synthetase (AMP-forming)/AMP-acid ligase II